MTVTKSFKISRITVLEGLAPISKAVMEACKYGDVHLIIDDESRTVQTSAAFLKGLVAEYNKGKKLECPVCGGTVSKVETFFGDDGYVCEKCRKHLPSEMFQGKAYFISEQGVANFVGKTIGEFEGDSMTKTFTIAKPSPAKPSISKLTAGKKSFTVKWAKKSVTGYEIQYSLKSNMSGAKTVKITSYKTVSKTVKNLKAKKKYYVQIRSYETVAGTKYYSSWSTKKTVTTK